MSKQRFDIMQVIKNMDGTDAMVNVRTDKRCLACGRLLAESEPFTLRKAFVQCLTSDQIGPNGMPILASGPVRYRRVGLARRIDKAKDTIRLTNKQIGDLGELAAIFLGSVAQYQVWNILGIEDDDFEDDEEDTDDIDDEENEEKGNGRDSNDSV